MQFQQWFEGIYLIGQFNWFRTGCWLLEHQGEAAILEMPPTGFTESSPATQAQEMIPQLGSPSVKYLLCTHCHWDHFSRRTFRKLRAAFPDAEPYLHRGFRKHLGPEEGIFYFDDEVSLDLSGEPLFLVHAPKHSFTDTMVIFRGAACTGDWELGTIRSVHDWTKLWAVSQARKLESITWMEQFPAKHNYVIHQIFSVHANDKREGIDFPSLMASTRGEQSA